MIPLRTPEEWEELLKEGEVNFQDILQAWKFYAQVSRIEYIELEEENEKLKKEIEFLRKTLLP